MVEKMSLFKVIIFSFFLSCTFSLQAQQDSTDTTAYTLLGTIPQVAIYSTTDKLQQLYISTSDNTIIKYAPTGKTLFSYNNNTLGDVRFIDATDPFNILVYYPDFKTLITLDRTLNKTGEFNLFNFDIVDVQIVAMSNNNTIWLYDNATFKLKKINANGELIVESDDLSLLLQQSLAPTFMIERNNLVYINDPVLGVYVFDIFGQYIKRLEIIGLQEFQLLKDQLLYLKGNKLHSFHLTALLDGTIALPQQLEETDRIHIQKDKLFWVGIEDIKIYRFD